MIGFFCMNEINNRINTKIIKPCSEAHIRLNKRLKLTFRYRFHSNPSVKSISIFYKYTEKIYFTTLIVVNNMSKTFPTLRNETVYFTESLSKK